MCEAGITGRETPKQSRVDGWAVRASEKWCVAVPDFAALHPGYVLCEAGIARRETPKQIGSVTHVVAAFA